MKTRMTVIAASVALMFASAQLAHAVQKMHEEEWGKTPLYGDVTIAGDKVDDWGPWKEFVQPAAGAPGVGFLGGGRNDPPPPIPPTHEEGCAAGSWCGYVVYNTYAYGDGQSVRNRPQAGLIELRPTPDDPSVVTVLGGSGAGMQAFKITPMEGSDPLLVMPGLIAAMNGTMVNVPVDFGMDTTWVGTRDGLANFSGYDGGESNLTIDGVTLSGWNAGIAGHNRVWARGKDTGDQYDATPYMTMGGYLYVSIWGYVNGSGDESYYNYISASDGAEGYVAGIVTPMADMAALQAGNVTASYVGFTSGGKSTSYQSPVAMTVNFGNATWSGTWNGGSDSLRYISKGTDSDNRDYVVGRVGLIASGTVTGANFQSTSVSANKAVSVTGSVQGSFYGPQAAGLGGVVNVVKTTEAYGPASYVDVFAAQKVTAPTPR